MTEAEWLAATDPQPMVEFLRGKASDRKLRLFACACARRYWLRLTDARTRAVIKVSERYADGLRSLKELQAADEAARVVNIWAYLRARSPQGTADERAGVEANCLAISTAEPAGWDAASRVVTYLGGSEHLGVIGSDIVAYAHEIFGNPFRPAHQDLGWLQRDDGATSGLAHTIYQRRTFRSLSQLASALADAGCRDAELLGHLRGPGPHVRGCWALDLVLGKS